MKIFLKSSLICMVAGCIMNVFAGEAVIVRVYDQPQRSIKTFISQQYDVAAVTPGLSVDIVISIPEYNALIAGGYRAEIIQRESVMRRNLGAVGDKAAYRKYSDLQTELQKIAADHPAICKFFDIGDSEGKIYYGQGKNAYLNYNHDIMALKISDNVAQEEDEPCVLFCGEHHAREPISLEVTMAVLNYIVDNYGKDSTVTKNVDSKQIWFVPLVNPNGHKKVMDGETMWRKNLRDNNSDSQISGSGASSGATADGVDVNRNYGYQWGLTGSSTVPGEEAYHGPAAWSEPEALALKNLLDGHHFVAGITYHSYSELVLWPYAYALNTNPPDYKALEQLGKEMAATIPSISGSGYYAPKMWYQLYPAMGIIDDYAYAVNGVFMYTIELGLEFIPPVSSIQKMGNDNIKAAMILLSRVNKSTLTGHAWAVADTGKVPVVGEVYLKEIDDTAATNCNFRKPYKTNGKFGTYYRILPTGTYTVTFKPDNQSLYKNITVNAVKIKGTDTTLLDFVYTSTGVVNNLQKGTMRSRLVIARAMDNIVLYPPENLVSDLSIFSIKGSLLKTFSYSELVQKKFVVQWDISSVPAGMYLIKYMAGNARISTGYLVVR